MANQFLALAMFVMLLSFFIVLNSMSEFEINKTKPILDSLSMAFSTSALDENLEPNVEPSPSESYRKGDALDHLEALFRSEISGVEAKKNRLGTMMHMRVPVKKFEDAIMPPIPTKEGEAAPFGGDFLLTFVSLMEAQEMVPYRMDIVLNVADNPADLQNDKPEDSLRLIKQVSNYVVKLEEAGLPSKLITGGLGKGKTGMMDLYFHRYVPFNPVGIERAAN